MTIRKIRTQLFFTVVVLAIVSIALTTLWHPVFWIGIVVTVPLVILGLYDLLQKRHSLLRNYPLIGRFRFLLEDTGPELRQYIVEANTEGKPFNRDQRSLIYQRAKSVVDKKPFGTEVDVYGETYAWLGHSMCPKDVVENPHDAFRVRVGDLACTAPYDASILNISAMSFGSLSPNAILAMNKGAKMGGFAQVTGEGGVSRYHLEHGGDLIWQIGTGYFGCRNGEGRFDESLFVEQAAHEAVKMIEVKLSQGAKPGHGGILPASKITPEIARARKIPLGRDCVSPPYHTAFTTPIELCEFMTHLREKSGGKPVGFKLCVGRPYEFFAVCKAMLETGQHPDFITVDGAEGGTGAAPIEFSDHIGVPVREGIVFVHNALVGVGMRDKVKIAAAGKLVTAFEIARAIALGADWCNSARAFMFAVGCVQAQACHTNECPVGVATQDPKFQRALVVEDKAVRVRNFHHNTVDALAEVIAAAGLTHPDQLDPRHIYQRVSPTEIHSCNHLYEFFHPGQLIDGTADEFQSAWDAARAGSFEPV